MEKLEILFNNVLNKSYKLRKAHPTKFDGLGFWQPIKKILEPLDLYTASKWKTISKSKTHKIMLLSEYTIDGYETKTINEQNHFAIQQVRIPLKEKPNIKKIIQIALNIGQYKGHITHTKTHTKKHSNTYVNFTKLDEFILHKDIVKLSTYLTNDIMANINDYLQMKNKK